MSPKIVHMRYRELLFVKRNCFLPLAISLVLVAGYVCPTHVFAQASSPVIKINEEAAKVDITVEKLRGNISVLFGSGGNIVVLTGPDGKLLVDAGIAVSRAKIQAALDGISSKPVKYFINTHWHWDHTDGNEWVHNLGATIVAHENVAKRLSATTRVEEWNYTFQPWPTGARPTVLVKTEKILNFDGEDIRLKNRGADHTDGDLSVYFTKADVLVMGDNFWNGLIRWVDASLADVTDKTIIIPGHGPVGSRNQLIEFRDMLVAIRDNVSSLKKQGKSIDEVVAANPTAAYDKKWGGYVISGPFFTRLVYAACKLWSTHLSRAYL